MLSFKNDFKDWEETIIIHEKTEGYYDKENANMWVDGKTNKVEVKAIVFQMNIKDLNSNIKHDEGGHYTVSDIKIYIHQALKIGQKVEWKDKVYTISDEIDYTSHSEDLRIYMARKGV